MTYDNVVAELVTQVPELAPRLAEHQQDYDEILPHVFFGDVVRYVEAHCDELTTAMPDLGTVQCGAYRVLQFLHRHYHMSVSNGEFVFHHQLLLNIYSD